MGPKKKGASKSGGGGGGGAAKDGAPKAYKISRQLDQERIDFLATFFATGLKILTRTKRDLGATARLLVLNIIELAIATLVVALTVILLATPIVRLPCASCSPAAPAR